jgi:hypothetical protein
LVANLFGAVVGKGDRNFKTGTGAKAKALPVLAKYLGIENWTDTEENRELLIDIAKNTYVFALTQDISPDGIHIDGNPKIHLSGDLVNTIWHPVAELESFLLNMPQAISDEFKISKAA